MALGAGCALALSPCAFGADDLADQASQTARKWLADLPKGYSARYDSERRLLYVSSLDENHLRETMQLLAAYTDAQRAYLLKSSLTWNVTILLPTAADYRRFRPGESVNGFYRNEDRTLISLDRGRVLVHEFTHALHDADASAAGQTHPVWICEGLAALFDSTRIGPEGLAPRTCDRLLTLQRAIRLGTTIPLDKLVSMSQDRFLRESDLCYAESRYLLLYLHESGVLAKWYEAYKDGYSEDSTGKRALEKTLGKRLFQIEDDWKKWVAAQKLTWGELSRGQARLGAELQDDPQGAKVVSLIRGSAAERSGRIREGDIIREFNGHTVRNAAELVNAIRAAGAKQTVTIRLVRNGRTLSIDQPLGSPSDD